MTTSEISLSRSPLTVTADSSFTLSNTNGIILTGTGGLSFTQAAGSSGSSGIISGYAGNIQAINIGGGLLAITTAGVVNGTGEGIFAYNQAGTDLTVKQTGGSINGGIETKSYGSSGSIIITTAGAVTATNSPGVSAYNQIGKDVAVTQNAGTTITGTYSGISAEDDGSGATSVTTAGNVIATGGNNGDDGNGVEVWNSGTGLTVTQVGGNITGAADGIYAVNSGTGALAITTAGSVTGFGTNGVASYGIEAHNQSGTDLTVNQMGGSINGIISGIAATNSGTGVLAITTAGNVTGSNGIYAINGASAQNLTVNQTGGTINGGYGVWAVNSGTSASSVTQAAGGSITGQAGDGVHVTNGSSSTAAGTDLSVNLAGAVSGTQNGLEAFNYGSGNTTIASSGTISGTGATTSSTALDGSTNSNSGYGIYAYNAASAQNLTLTQTGGGITGSYYGIYAWNFGTGALAITTADSVTGTNSVGIGSYNSSDGSDVTVNQTGGSITGGNVGIQAINNGGGLLAITTAGNVTGTRGYGISASTMGTDLTVNQTGGSITGDYDGIDAMNNGRGALTVTTAGNVTGTNGNGIGNGNGNGIYAYNAASARDLTIQQTGGSIIGSTYGVGAINQGSGATSVTQAAAGSITGQAGDGVSAMNGTAGTDLSVNLAGTVSGTKNGLDALNYGSGNTTIASSGTISGTGTASPSNVPDGSTKYAGYGIYAWNAASVQNLAVNQTDGTITGGTYGVGAVNSGTGAASVTQAAGSSIAGQAGDGVYVTNGSSSTTAGTDISVSLASTVNGTQNGLEAFNYGSGNTAIASSGTISGTGATTSSTAPDGSTNSNSGYGIYALNGASAQNLTVNQTAGSIAGSVTGIWAQNQGKGATSVSSAGTVSGGSPDGYGIYAVNSANGTTLTVNQAGGNITAGQDGIRAQSYGTDVTVTQTGGTVTGGLNGIREQNYGTGVSTVTQAAGGSITGSSNDGIQVVNGTAPSTHTGTDISINVAGTVGGGRNGIEAANYGTGQTTIVSSGTVTGTSSYGIWAYNSLFATTPSATNITVTQTAGSITGTSGIFAQNAGLGATTISTAGTVTGTSGVGIYAYNSGSSTTNLAVEQQASGKISGTSYGIFAYNSGTGGTTVSADGMVSGGASYQGIYAFNSSTNLSVTQGADGGSITGGKDGIYAYNLGTGTTSVTTASTVSGTSRYGIYAYGSANGTGLAVEQEDGTISGGKYGVVAVDYGSGIAGTTQTGGSITGGLYGVSLYNFGSGASSVAQAAGGSITGQGGDGVYVRNGTSTKAAGTDISVSLAGTVNGTQNGLEAFNYGSGNTTIASSGTISGTGATISSTAPDGSNNSNSGYGIYAWNDASAQNLTLTQTGGTITGGYAGVDAINNGTGSATIITAGTVTGTKGDGIDASNGSWGGSTGTDLTVSQTGGRISGYDGIDAINWGTGVLAITTAGTVIGTNGDGIDVGSFGTGLTVNQTGGSITGNGGYGVAMLNQGSGAALVTQAAGSSIAGQAGDGVYVTNGSSSTAAGTDISVNLAGTVSGAQNGLDVYNYGSGNTTIASSGTISGTGATTSSTAPDGSTNSNSGNGIYVNNGASAQNLTVNQTGGSIIGGGNGINTTNNGTGATAVTSAGAVTGGTGAGILTTSLPGSTVTIDLQSGANVSSSSGLAIQDTDGDASVTLESGSTLAGAVRLGNGNNALTVEGTADISAATVLDGGNLTDPSVTNILGTSGATTNKLTFLDTTQNLAGSQMVNWQTVALNNSSLTFSTDAALITGTGTNPDGSLQGVVLTNSSMLTSPVTLAVTGDMNIDATSTLWHALGGSITGNVTSAGLIYWGNLGHTLAVNGNYTGEKGARLSLETWLADDNSTTDKLHVTGNTSGSTALIVRPVAGSPGAKTVNGIQVIQVDGISAPNSFTLASPVQAGAYQYVLQQGGAVSGGQSWYLTSSYNCNLNQSCTSTPVTPVAPGTPLYRPGLANYLVGQTANTDQGFLQLSTFHQRMGAQEVEDDEGRQTWLRPYVSAQNNRGTTRFGYSSVLAGFQLGQDIWVQHTDNGITERTAFTFDYGADHSNINDRLRPFFDLDKHTGSLDAQSIALGGTYTRQDSQGGYLDVVGQVASLRNNYNDSYGSESVQNGLRGAVSVESGKIVANWGGWDVEPQGQLAYMHTRYSSFSDAQGPVNSYSTDALRGRLGVRLVKDNGPQADTRTRYYGVANVLHDFTKPDGVTVDGTSVSERFSHTSGEIGLGMQQNLQKDSYAYVDTRFQQSLDGPSSRGVQFNLGLKFAF